MNTVRPALCAVSEGGVLRSREGFGSRPTQNFSYSSASMDPMIALSSSGSSGRISARIVPANAPDTNGLILGFGALYPILYTMDMK